MKVKRDDDGHAIIKEIEGKEFVVYTDGKRDEDFYPPSMKSKIKEQAEDLATVEKDTDKEMGDLRKQLRAWERLGDIKDVRAAVSTVKTLGEKDLDASKLPAELAEAQATAATLHERVKELETEVESLGGENYKLGVGNVISSAVREMQLIDGITPDQVERLIDARNVFRKENGRYVPYRDNKPMMVVGKDGEPRTATPTEALQQLIPDAFKKASGARGSDAKGDLSTQTAPVAGSVKTKADLKSPEDKAKFISEHGIDAFVKLPHGHKSRDDVATF